MQNRSLVVTSYANLCFGLKIIEIGFHTDESASERNEMHGVDILLIPTGTF